MSRSVLVTDDERGVGRAVAAVLREAGHRVTVAHRDGPPPPELFAVPCDPADKASVDRAFEAAEQRHGPVEILVAGSRRGAAGSLGDLTGDSFSQLLDVNLVGTYRLVRRALPGMLRRRWGRLIFVAAAPGYRGAAGHSDAAASAAGLVGIARSLVRELGPRGVTANVVAPGVLEGDPESRPPERNPDTWSEIPLGRSGTAAEVAAAVGYLASAEAAYVTGAVLPVDGGVGMGN
ncbi:SDR family oxidoreductase [Actinoplanes sp. NPDC051411]|uniref:SDR family oxidoreductase n=1 Tax=Actinoplanes sp. NPDC051411 TaxID=3155522 RepID=UPI00341232E6